MRLCVGVSVHCSTDKKMYNLVSEQDVHACVRVYFTGCSECVYSEWAFGGGDSFVDASEPFVQPAGSEIF